jgi:hypothetical protein
MLLALLQTVLTGPVFAQASPVHAVVDRTTASTDDTVTLVVTVLGPDASRPTLPVLDGFRLVGSGSSSRITIVNGVTSAEASYSYSLRPTKEGELVIPAITVSVGGQSYSTDPITVQVTQGSTPAQPPAFGDTAPAPSQTDGKTFFVEAEVDNPTPYLGEQLNYIFRFYQAETLLAQPGYDPPDFPGFWSQQGTGQVQYFVERDSVNYRVTELRTILFPSVAGERTIGPGAFQLPGTFLSAGATLQSNPVVLTIRPAPVPAPDDFSGAVGQLAISATIEPSTVAVNEPATLRVSVRGQANIDTLPGPELPELDGWRTYESTSSVSTQVQDGRVTGERVYEQLFVPVTAGEYTIPSISYTYFDPETETYVTVRTEPIMVTATEGAVEPPIPSAPAVAQEAITQIDSDIRHIKPVPPQLDSAPSSLTKAVGYWILWILPLLVVAADWAWRRRQQYRISNPDQVRRSRALKRARRIIRQARQQKIDPHTVIGQALSGYLSDKMNESVAGLTQAALVGRLETRGVDGTLLDQVREALSLVEMGRFAPAGSNGATQPDIFNEIERLIIELDKVL